MDAMMWTTDAIYKLLSSFSNCVGSTLLDSFVTAFSIQFCKVLGRELAHHFQSR